MNSAKPYIGCKIALISKAQNRYEGILYTIDKVNSTVVLAKVKCFGTEGRATNRPTPPRDDIYEYITFRGSDIKDINLSELPHSPRGLFPDPAILESSGASSSESYSTLNLGLIKVPVYHQSPSRSLQNENYAAALDLGMPIRKGPMVEKSVQTIGLERSRQILPPSHEEWERRTSQGRPPVQWQQARPQPSRESYLRAPMMPMRGGFGYPPPRQHAPRRNDLENIPPRRRQGAQMGRYRQGQLVEATLRFDTDFDFDSSNEQFMKEQFEVHNDVNNDSMGKEHELSNSPFDDDAFGPKCFYNKAKCFYDNMSSDQKLRFTWAEERQRNLETFGVPGRFRRNQGFRGGYTRGRGQRTVLTQ